MDSSKKEKDTKDKRKIDNKYDEKKEYNKQADKKNKRSPSSSSSSQSSSSSSSSQKSSSYSSSRSSISDRKKNSQKEKSKQQITKKTKTRSRSRSRSKSQEKKSTKQKQQQKNVNPKQFDLKEQIKKNIPKHEELPKKDIKINYKKKSKSREKEDRNDDDNKDFDQKNKEEEIKINNSDLIESLRDGPSFLAQKYNEMKKSGDIEEEEFKVPEQKKQKQVQKQPEPQKQQQQVQPKPLDQIVNSRAGGVYIPPHKLQQLQQEILASEDKNSREHQKLMWELLRKSINGIINKVNITNIQHIVIELLNENILRGKGLLARAIIKAQMASPNFTHVYAALIAVINTKLPEIVALIAHRVLLQFQKAFKRNNRIVCKATTKMIAHLINQQVLSDLVGLELLALLLENPTEDSVEIACDFMIEVGQVLSELTPAGSNAIFERFKGILHEGEIDKRVQYSIENLFAIRKTKFKDHSGIIPELDLVEQEDQISHQISLDDDLNGEEILNIFKFDPFFEKTEQEWTDIKHEILGEENILKLKTIKRPEDIELEEEMENEEENANKIQDFTEQDLKNLRRTIYLTIMNSVDYEECATKLIKMNIGEGHEDEMAEMFVECCQQERTYLKFYGLLAQRFCNLYDVYKEHYERLFNEKYEAIHRFETNKLRNIAKFFAHLLFTNAIEWKVLAIIKLTQEDTTASSRIFIKILIQELCEHLGLERLNNKFQDPDLAENFKGLFPKDDPRNTRFSINFLTSIGLGALTEDLRHHLDNLPKLQFNQEQIQLSESSSSDSDSSDDSSSDSDSDSSSSKSSKS